MPSITFIDPDGGTQAVQAELGHSLMEVAINGGVSGIIGECGGMCQCATCHVYIGPQWRDRLPAISPEEEVMLENTAAKRQPESRLSCRIRIIPEHDGMIVSLPDRQI